MPSGIRVFVAVRPSPAAVEHLDDFLEVRRSAGSLRWTAYDQLHLTLAFFAGVPEHRLDDLAEGLTRAAVRHPAASVRIAGGGAFPDAARARVLWAGLQSSVHPAATRLDVLAAKCRAAANHSGVEVDGTRFRPHLTVARTGRPQELTRWVRLLDAYTGPAWTIDGIELVQSHLGEGPRGRPRHSVLASVPVGGTRSETPDA